MTIGTNTLAAGRPHARRQGHRQLVRQSLSRELVGNVSLDVLPTERPDTWEVRGRGKLQRLAPCWWRTMRREELPG